jgi:hypothetical protein
MMTGVRWYECFSCWDVMGFTTPEKAAAQRCECTSEPSPYKLLPLEKQLEYTLEQHQIVWVDSEVGYDCGCNERGDLAPMLYAHDARMHQVSMIRTHIQDALAEQRDLIAESIEPSPDDVIDECCSNSLWAASVRVRRAES